MTDYDINDDDRWEQVHRERVRMQTQLDRLAERVERLETQMRIVGTPIPQVVTWSGTGSAPAPPAPAPDEAARTHDLKTVQPYFDAVSDGVKTFEIRKNDRGFQVGDTLRLREWDGQYTGRDVSVTVTYLTDYEQQPGYVVMGIRLAAPADRVVKKPNAEDMAETICQWQNVLGSEGLAKKLIELYWIAGADTQGEGE